MDQNRPFWSILVSRILKSGSEQGHFDQNGRLDHFRPFCQYTFRQYRGQALNNLMLMHTNVGTGKMGSAEEGVKQFLARF